MPMNKIRKVLSIVFLTLILSLVFISATSVKFKAEENYGLALQLDETSGDTGDTATIGFDDYVIQGDHIGIKLDSVKAVNQNGANVTWTMLQIALFDKDGNKYYTRQLNGETTSSGVTVPSFDDDGNYQGTTYGYSYIWPTINFYGTVYIPLSEFTTTDNEVLEVGDTINSVSITHNSKSNSRTKMLTYFFELVEADLTIPDFSNQWVGDVHILHSFDKVSSKNSLSNKKQILDFTTVPIDEVQLEGKNMYARKMEKSEYDSIVGEGTQADTETWKKTYTTSGQKFSFEPVDNGIYNEALFWKYGMYFEDYDANLNSYGSLGFATAFTDWTDALGLTIYVKSLQSHPASFNLEFAEKEDGGAERWNLNGDLYRTIYAYDINTGEEYGFHSLVVCELPANFEGWIRIPFSEYEVPSWSLANAWCDGKLTLSKPHGNIYITSQFVKNDSSMFIFDNVGLYYHDFEVGKLFDRTKLSIKECLELEGYGR